MLVCIFKAITSLALYMLTVGWPRLGIKAWFTLLSGVNKNVIDCVTSNCERQKWLTNRGK
jgi:hypothetical protein